MLQQPEWHLPILDGRVRGNAVNLSRPLVSHMESGLELAGLVAGKATIGSYRIDGTRQLPDPCQHDLKEWLQEYIEAAGLAEDPNGPLFRSVDRKTKQIGANRLDRQRAWAMIKRRAKKAGIDTPGICNHTFRGTGITAYLENPEAKLEHAQQMAAHSDPKTTRLYDRRSDQVSLDEVERVGI